MKITFTFLTVLSLFSFCFAQNNGGWLIQNISTDLVSVDYSSPEVGWAVGEKGVILKTTDSGSTWNFQNSIQTDTGVIGTGDCVSVEFINNSVGWIAKRYWTLLRTSNGGFTWETVLIDSLVHGGGAIISTYFLDELKGFVNTTIGVFKTTDGGESWSLKTNQFSILFTEVNFIDELTGWGTAPNGEILFTIDGGDSWSFQTSTIIEHIMGISFTTAQPGIGLAIGRDGAVIKTTDYGVTWTKLDSLTSSNLILTDVKFLNNSLTAYVVGYSGKIFKTTDAGETWTQQTSPQEFTDYFSVSILSETDALIVGEESTIISTSDGGDTWTIQSHTPRAGFSSSVINDLEFANSQIGIAVSGFGQGYRTTNGGNDWKHFDLGESNDLTDVCITSDRTEVYIAGDFRILFKSTDAGETWIDQNPSGLGINFTYAIAFNSSGDGVLSGRTSFAERGLLYKTNNDGKNWTQVYRDSLNRFYDLKNINFSSFIAAGDSGIILRSVDRGDTWNRINSGTTSPLFKLHFNSGIGWALGLNVLLKTTNAGISWTVQDLDLPLFPNDIFFVSESVGYIAGQNFSSNSLILKTTDGGLSWEEQFVPLSIDEITSICFFGENIGWAGGEYGTIFKTTTGGLVEVTGEENINEIIPERFTLYQNYPNPFNPLTTIQYSIPQRSNVTLKVYDILGNEVATLVNKEKETGVYSVTFNASGLSSGIYFYRIQTSSFNQVKKMLLIK